MKTLNTSHAHGTASSRCLKRGMPWLIGAAVIMVCALVQADDGSDSSSGSASWLESEVDSAPWTPDVIQALDEYLPSPTFNSGRYYFDHFAAPTTADVVGRVTAQMSNGDIVVAGLVPDFGTTSACGNGTVLCNIGLVHYSPAGVRLAWSNPGSHGHAQNNYVIFPGDPFPISDKYENVRDIKVHGGTIYVMVDARGPGAGLGRKNVRVIAFNLDGSITSNGNADVFGYGSSAGDIEDFYGAQMVFLSNNRMIVTATTYSSSNSYLSVNKFIINDGGSLFQDPTWGSSYAGQTINRIIRYPTNVPYTVGYAVNAVGAPSQDDFYMAGSYRPQGDFNVLIQKISSLTGNLKPEFGGAGWVEIDFAQPNSSRDDYAAGLYVYQDDVYVGAQVAQKCHAGIGLAKINGANGLPINAFGVSGRIVFGGQGNSALCAAQGGLADVPNAISATGGRIGIAGYRGYRSFVTNAYSVDPMLAVVNAVNGVVLDIDIHPVFRANGTRYGDAVLYDIYGGPSVTSPFTVAGVGRDANNGNTLSYITGRFIPISADRIFASGFDN